VRAVVQRVSRAEVRVDADSVGRIGHGVLALLSVGVDDDESDVQTMAQKIAGLRIFPDAAGLMNRSVQDNQGSVLLVSQFTLHGDVRRGRRPSFISAAKEPQANKLYEAVGRALEAMGVPVAYGRFGARMSVELVNEGPVTILIDTKRLF
jgi:D-tyrosyl-tRNA(Tyr) deacylase